MGFEGCVGVQEDSWLLAFLGCLPCPVNQWGHWEVSGEEALVVTGLVGQRERQACLSPGLTSLGGRGGSGSRSMTQLQAVCLPSSRTSWGHQ